MTDHTANAFQYLDGYMDAFAGNPAESDNEHYREGYAVGEADQARKQEKQPAPFCAPDDDDCEACQ